jgi:secondary thiamine-phosphate synthase enzyme
MMVVGESLRVRTKGLSDVVNVTPEVKAMVRKSGVREGIVNVSVVGSTASVSTIEFEPALVQDMQEALERLVPRTVASRHSQTWGDDNGFSHMRATLMGPSITVPIVAGNPRVGTWQQIVVVDHDNRPREREVYVQVMGE